MSETTRREECAIADKRLTGGTGLAAEASNHPFSPQCAAQDCKLRGIDLRIRYGAAAVTVAADPRDSAHQPAPHCARERSQPH